MSQDPSDRGYMPGYGLTTPQGSVDTGGILLQGSYSDLAQSQNTKTTRVCSILEMKKQTEKLPWEKAPGVACCP